jgi:ABC-type polysaccharide/polyol phosphate transport system ATPase subunit
VTEPRAGALVIQDVAKSFQIPREQVHTLKEKALHPFRRTAHDEFRALRGVTFDVKPGEFFGIVGRNGSGKSTLLKCMAGIYGTDRGQIYVDGRLSTFIELGVGFNPDLAAFDNVLLNATMLGLSPREARRRFDRIIDFAELREFVDLKIKNYSSGMLVRLAFSVMIQVDADILLIDEVLAVGDAAFQQKCFDEFGRIRRSGATVVLVTHEMGAVQRFCDRAMLMEHGKVVDIGDTQRVADRYLELNFSAEARAEQAEIAGGPRFETPAAVAEPESEAEEGLSAGEVEEAQQDAGQDHLLEREIRFGDGRAEIVEAWFEDENGRRAELVTGGRRCAFKARVRFHADLIDPLFGIDLYNSQGLYVWSANNSLGEPSGRFAAGEETLFAIAFPTVFAPDRYWASPAIAFGTQNVAWVDKRERFCSVVVKSTRPTYGLVDIDFDFQVEAPVDGVVAES